MTLKKLNVPHHIEIRKNKQTHIEEKHAMEKCLFTQPVLSVSNLVIRGDFQFAPANTEASN